LKGKQNRLSPANNTTFGNQELSFTNSELEVENQMKKGSILPMHQENFMEKLSSQQKE
jgi:hypothetical protein